MNLALGLSTLLLAGWVLPSGESDDTAGPPTPPSGIQTPQQRGDMPRTRSAGGPMDNQSPLYRYGTPSNSERPMRRQEQQVPLPPTDPDSTLAAPTEQGGGAGPGYGTPLGGNVPMGMGARPMGPPRGASAASRSRSSAGGRYGASSQQNKNPQRDLAIMEQQASRLQPSAGISSGGAAAAVNKPFSNISQSPAVSPYMNLYRRDTGGTDNYYSFVRPQLDQRRANQVIGGEIRGLQSNQQLQSHAVQRLGKTNPAAQTGTMAPEYFQNYGAFYPRFSR